MAGARQTGEAVRARADDTPVDNRRRVGAGRGGGVAGPYAVLTLQRHAGNAAVSALMAAKTKSPDGQSVGQIDAALKEIRRGEPAIDTVEQGLNAAKAAGVPVELEGPKPPASALAVTLTGFGPAQVAPRKPVPPAKEVPPVSPVGKAGAAAPKARGSGPGRGTAGAAPPTARVGGAGAGSAPAGSAPLSGEPLQPPAPPTSIRPEDDPAFAQVKTRVKAVATGKRAHPPASSKAKEAQHAALPPTDDLGAQAKASKVDAMDAQQPGTFDKKAFIAAVKAAIEAKSPTTLKEADDYKKSGTAGEVKGEVKGLVTQGKEEQAKDIEAATDAQPDPSKAVPKPVAPMVAEKPGAAVSVPAAGAVPKPAPAEQTNLAAGKYEANQEMAEAGVSDQQLAESNEPEFQQALSDKRSAAAHADSAPGAYRQAEQQVLQQGRAQASEVTVGGVAGMQSSKAAALAGVASDKEKTKTKDEAKRAQVTARIRGIFAATEADVKKALDGIDPKVEAEFTRGEAAARRTFEAYVAMKMAAYKADRYSGVLGGLRWAKDKLLGMPSKVNEFFAAGRELYLKAMERVITRVADVVGNALTAAKRRIAKGRADIAAYVKGLPADLKNVGSEASQEIGERFEQLTASVDAKQDSVVDTLATKYVEARTGLDERVEALQAENRGLVDKAIGAIKGVINTIRELANMLRTALARASSVVGEIVKKPVAFLKNLIAGVKGGILRFKDNIVGHLKKGLLSWLFGALAAGGIELPERFDLKGIINLVSSVFGLTWRAIRQRIARRIGEPVMGAVEKGVDIFQKLAAEGVGGLWQMVVEKVGDIKAMLVEKVQDLVITQVITAGIKWLISLLNPAAAFIKACKLIYDVVMFFVNNARRFVHFVSTVIGSVVDIVRGNVSGVVDKVEGALSQMVPILIGFLASVLGLGGLGEKVREIVMTLQKPVKKAVDWIIGVGLKLAAPVIRGLKGLGGKAKAKLSAGKAWAKGKALGGDDSPEGRRKRLENGLGAGVAAANKFGGRPVGVSALRPVLGLIRRRYGLAALEPVPHGQNWAIHGTVARIQDPAPTTAKVPSAASTAPSGSSPDTPVPARRWLPTSYREKGQIRRRLYETGSGWSTLRSRIDRHMRELLAVAFDVLAGHPRSEIRSQLVSWVAADKIPEEVLNDFDTADRVGPNWLRTWLEGKGVTWHVDHKHPLAAHWKSHGHNSDDSERHRHATDVEQNLEWITAQANLAKGSAVQSGDETERHHYVDQLWVGPDFTSARAEGGRIGARLIDNEPFLDGRNGKPLT